MKLSLHKGLHHDISRWIEKFSRDLKHRSDKKNTHETYSFVLTRLTEYSLKEKKSMQSIEFLNRDNILDFIQWCEEKSKKQKYSKKTKILYLSILKAFFNYISDHSDEYIDFSSHFKRIMPKGGGKKIPYLSDDEVDIVLNYLNINLSEKRHYSYIYSLGIKLMLFGGLRISEVLLLEVKDITISNLLNQNGERDLYEIFLKDTKSVEEQSALVKIEDIQKEIDYFRHIYGQSDCYIFRPIKKEVIMNRKNFYSGVNNIFIKCGLPHRRGLHIFRHTCAMQLYRKTGDVLVTQKKLRHFDIKTTMIYASAEQKDVANATR